MPYGTVNTDKLQGTLGGTISPDSSVFRNRIINGAMVIDQRNSGNSVTPAAGDYTVDRWNFSATQSSKVTMQRNAGSVTPPAGFTNYLGVTSSSAYSIANGDWFMVNQPIEGFTMADLGFGTANAKTITLSFWVRSSLTGTFGGVINNEDNSRGYPFTYTISQANTWEQKTVTIPGDTGGTWIGATNGRWGYVRFGLGVGSTYSGTAGSWSSSTYFSATGATSVVGTNGATWYITGVQLEAGSTASSFEYRPYGTELILCQRYYQRFSSSSQSYPLGPVGYVYGGSAAAMGHTLPVSLRGSPAISYNAIITRGGRVDGTNQSPAVSSVSDIGFIRGNHITYTIGVNSAVLTIGTLLQICNNSPADDSTFLAYSSEL
jgi:hypothetical protein